MNVFRQLIIFFGFTLIPYWSLIIWNLKLNGKKYFVLTVIPTLTFTVYRALNNMWFPIISSWLHLYSLFLVFYLVLFTEKYGFKQFNKAFAVSVFTVYLASEIWEIPVFLPYLLRFPTVFNWLHPAYLIISFYLFIKITRFTWNKLSIGLVALIPLINYWLLNNPFPNVNTIVRVVGLTLFGYAIYLGVKK